MKNFHWFVLFIFLLPIFSFSHGEISSPTKKITILATGGTIAGSGDSKTKAAYTAGEIPIEDLLNAVPEIHSKAIIKGEQFSNIGSQDMDINTLLKLSRRINEIFKNEEADGIVITHGTDTMEETAYFLSLTLHFDKPVVLVGAMRPATAISQDGNKNLLDAVSVAAAPETENKGVLVVMNEFIFDARSVEKTSTTNTSAFQSPNFGPMGMIFDGKVSFYYEPIRNSLKRFDVRELETLPRVDILYGYIEADPKMIDFAVEQNAEGIVYAGVGNGNFSKAVESALSKSVEKGVVVCRSSRIEKGKVTLENEVDDKGLGFIVSDDLNPQKARILLMLALTKTKDKEELQKIFFSY